MSETLSTIQNTAREAFNEDDVRIPHRKKLPVAVPGGVRPYALVPSPVERAFDAGKIAHAYPNAAGDITASLGELLTSDNAPVRANTAGILGDIA